MFYLFLFFHECFHTEFNYSRMKIKTFHASDSIYQASHSVNSPISYTELHISNFPETLTNMLTVFLGHFCKGLTQSHYNMCMWMHGTTNILYYCLLGISTSTRRLSKKRFSSDTRSFSLCLPCKMKFTRAIIPFFIMTRKTRTRSS